jgi:hypothetical protein
MTGQTLFGLNGRIRRLTYLGYTVRGKDGPNLHGLPPNASEPSAT